MALLVVAAAPLGAAFAGPPYRVAVTFDAAAVASWLHTDGAGTAPTAALATSGTGNVTRTSWVGATIPADVASVPGVVAGDNKVGVFPAYGADPDMNFAAVKVTPNSFGANDVLAPGTKSFTFGADIKFDSPMPADSRTADNGNNVIQRGLSAGDQYKIQIDKVGAQRKASCVLRDAGLTATSVTNSMSILPSTWYRLRCSRTAVGGVDQIVLTVNDLDNGTTVTSPPAAGAVLSNLNYPDATAAKPYPLAIGAKLKGNGTLESTQSDQFNGRIDNAYLGID